MVIVIIIIIIIIIVIIRIYGRPAGRKDFRIRPTANAESGDGILFLRGTKLKPLYGVYTLYGPSSTAATAAAV